MASAFRRLYFCMCMLQMFLAEIDDEKADLKILNVTILPSDQCATDEQRVYSCFLNLTKKNFF